MKEGRELRAEYAIRCHRDQNKHMNKLYRIITDCTKPGKYLQNFMTYKPWSCQYFINLVHINVDLKNQRSKSKAAFSVWKSDHLIRLQMCTIYCLLIFNDSIARSLVKQTLNKNNKYHWDATTISDSYLLELLLV